MLTSPSSASPTDNAPIILKRYSLPISLDGAPCSTVLIYGYPGAGSSTFAYRALCEIAGPVVYSSRNYGSNELLQDINDGKKRGDLTIARHDIRSIALECEKRKAVALVVDTLEDVDTSYLRRARERKVSTSRLLTRTLSELNEALPPLQALFVIHRVDSRKKRDWESIEHDCDVVVAVNRMMWSTVKNRWGSSTLNGAV